LVAHERVRGTLSELGPYWGFFFLTFNSVFRIFSPSQAEFLSTAYPGSAESMLAVERKEADGRAGSLSSMKPYIDRDLVRPLLRGRVPEEGIEHLPVNEDLTNDNKGKTIMAMYSAADLVGRPYVCPPGTPADLIEILRNAFAKVAKDPELLAEAKKAKIDIKYVPAEEILKVINDLLNKPEDIKKEFAKYISF